MNFFSSTFAVQFIFNVFVVFRFSAVVADTSGLLPLSTAQEENCSLALGRLFQHLSAPDLQLLISNISGSSNTSNICPALDARGVETCCTEEVQNKLKQLSVQTFQQKIQLSTFQFRSIVIAHSQQYRVYTQRILNVARNRTMDMLTKHRIVSRDAEKAVDHFFSQITFHFINTTDTSLETTVSGFFDESFATVLSSQINTTLPIDTPVRNCLMNLRASIRPHPFGIAPTFLLQDLQKSIGSAVAYTNALGVSLEMADQIDKPFFFGQDCLEALTRQHYCPSCLGLGDVRPCWSLCLQTTRDCMVHTFKLDPLWSLLVDALEQLVSTDKLSLSLDALQSIDIRMEEAITHFSNSLNLFFPQVNSECGPIRDPLVDSDSSTLSNLLAGDNASQQRLLNTQFDSELEMFLEHLKNTKDFLRRLPEDLCVSDDHSTRGKGMCWNGTSLVRNENPTVGLNEVSEKFQDSETMGSYAISNTSEFGKISNKLSLITEVLMNKVTDLKLMQTDEEGGRSSKLRSKRSQPIMFDDEDMTSSGSGDGGVDDISGSGADIVGPSVPTTGSITNRVVDPLEDLTALHQSTHSSSTHHHKTTTNSGRQQSTSTNMFLASAVFMGILSTHHQW